MASTEASPVISVLVPVFNWDVSRLAHSLLEEIRSERLEGQIEIIFADDCSTAKEIQAANRTALSVLQAASVSYLELERNLGRAAIRNHLVEQSTGEFLLFLDADVIPDNRNFLRCYLEHVRADSCDVVCGGISYAQRILTGPEYDFYVYMSSRAGIRAAAIRNLQPWRWMFTSNVMLRRAAFDATPFDRRFTGYGYEDVEWSIRLARKFRVLHVDNPVSHLGLHDPRKVLEDMHGSIQNYRLLAMIHPDAYAETSIAPVVRILRRSPAWALRSLDRLAVRAFLALSGIHVLAFFLFQFDKAVLLALAFQKPLD
jgi:glycosyltransferase involved in cell wall biosynthesis